IVKSVSDFAISWWWLLCGAAGLVACVFAFVLRTANGKLIWHRTLLRLPLLGDLILKQSIVRLSVVRGTLLKSGIPFVRGIQISQRTTANRVVRKALSRCEQAVLAGADIAGALRETNVFP